MSARESAWTGAMDRIGVFASAACFVHCLATPILLSLSSVSVHFLPSEESTHRVLAVTIALVGAIAILTGYRRHRRPSVLVFLSVGLVFIFAGAFFGNYLPLHWIEVLITLLGSSCLIAAHRKNHTFCRSCKQC
jgi:uncharacterized membrane protein YfcA